MYAHTVNTQQRIAARIGRVFGLMAVVASAVGCATAAPTVIRLDPIEIKHVQGVDGRTVYVRDFNELLAEAKEHYDARRLAKAAERYDLLVREFPTYEQIGDVQFNAGLCYLALQQFEEAIVRFRGATQRRMGTRDARDAVFLMAQAHERLNQHLQAAAIYGAMLGDEKLDGPEVERVIGGKLGLLDQLEARAKRAIALRAAGKPHRADRQLRGVLRLYQNHRDVRLVAESEWVARAYYERGELYRELFTSIRFKLPVERMQKELEDKAQLFLKAQNQYFRCVRLHDKKWSLAAGYEVGTLYARLIDDIYGAEVPPDLDADTVQAYKDELWKHTGNLAKKAVLVYQKNIDLARRLGKTGKWVERSERQLERMKALIDKESGRTRQYNAPVGAEPNDPRSKVVKDPARRRKRKR